MKTPAFWEEQDAFLRVDNVRGWMATGKYSNDDMNAWVKNNVAHACASCPQVMKHWKDDVLLWENHEVVLAKYTALALEAQPDAWKEHFLRGHPDGPLQGALFARLYWPSPWEIFSPGWIGQPGSGLRERVEQWGWAPAALPKQVVDHLHMGAAHLWGPMLDFPYTMAVLQRIEDKAGVRQKRGPIYSAAMPRMSLVAQAWANPNDVVVAARLAQQWTGIALGCDVEFGPQGHTLEPHAIEQLHTVVDMHLSLGLVKEFKEKVLRGTLLAAQEVPLGLPSLSEDGHGI